ncbi:MAG: hypothetical protein KC933_05640, partial [Myxococcales bacterium]|nr:hypothetical protein [Myxococcales bacterium]
MGAVPGRFSQPAPVSASQTRWQKDSWSWGRAVQVRLRADVPVGAYLSGGLDSSVIGERVREVSHEHLQTFAVRFADPRFDETEHQRRM